MVEIINLKKRYNNFELNINSLNIPEGVIYGFVGNNGAGKTTLLRLMLDLVEADEGIVKIQNYEIAKTSIWRDFTLSYLDEGFLFDFLTPEEYFFTIGKWYSLSGQKISDRLNAFKEFFNDEILEQKNKLIRVFSTGNKQKIGIASVFIPQPKIIILDEPFQGLDPSSQYFLKYKLTQYQKENNALVILSSHDLTHISEICTHVAIMERGNIVESNVNDQLFRKRLFDYFIKTKPYR